MTNSVAEKRTNSDADNTPSHPAAGCRAAPRPPRSCPSGPTSSRGRRPGRRQGRSLPGPGVCCHGQHAKSGQGPSCPGSATRSCRTIRSRPTAATSWTSCGTCRPRGRPPGGHGRPREALQASAPGSRPEIRHGRTAAFGHPRRLQGAGGQGARALGDGPGHRCGQGPRRPEELDAVLDPAAGHFALGGDPDRHLAGDPRPGLDERLFHHRMPGLGGGRCLRRAPRDRRGRALSPRHREAEQEAAEDPLGRRAAGPGLPRASGHRGG